MDKKLKILAASDIEGDSSLAKRLANKAEKEKVDLVVLCGDILGHLDVKGIIKPFKDKNKHVLIIPGNHDMFGDIDFLAQLYSVRNLHGYSVVYNGVGFFGAGGTDDIPFFPGYIKDTELFKTLEKANSGLKGIEKKVMVTHSHPFGSISEFSGVKGSKAVLKAIKKFNPSIVLHGHIHEAGGMEGMVGKTKVINVGREGKIIEI